MKKFFIIFSVALLAATACKKDEVIAPSGVTVDKSTVELFPGETIELNGIVSPSNATGKFVKWTTSNSAVAVVSEFGKVTALAPRAIDSKEGMGEATATITAKTTDGKFSADCKVIVKPFYLTGIGMDEKNKTEVEEFGTVTWKVVFTPANASYKAVTWKSGDETIAKVNENGVITGVKAGSTTITAISKDGEKTASKTITVKESTNFRIFVDDTKGEKALAAGPVKEPVISDFLTYEDGKITWAENKSGLPRQATICIYNEKDSLMGAACVMQAAEADFVGKWKFNANSVVKDKTKNTVNVEFSKFAGDNGNNILISGLYNGADVQGKVAIDYDARTAKVGVYVSSTTFYYSGKGKYCVLLPVCAETVDWDDDTINSFPKEDQEFSSTNYDWVWFDYSFDDGTLRYIFKDEKKAPQKSENGDYYYCGLSFGAASKTAITGSKYDVTYQANYDGKDELGMWFSR